MSIDFPLPVLTGPTAVGKTALSLMVAEAIGAEIISVDSRQIYRPLTIGTAKPEPEELTQVPHHFINELDLGDPFSAGMFALQAEERIAEILEAGRVPLIVGGSTLYLHALQYGLADIPSVPDVTRAHIEARLAQEGSEALYDELLRLDPGSAQTMDATKTQRLVRALEVYYGTGKPLSSYEQNRPRYRYKTVVLNRERTTLYERINQRVDIMLKAGLLDEVRDILATHPETQLNSFRTIGYQEPMAFLQGEIEYDEMVRLLKRNSRRYAKRQLTWFRRYPEYYWMEIDDVDASFSSVLDYFDLQ